MQPAPKPRRSRSSSTSAGRATEWPILGQARRIQRRAAFGLAVFAFASAVWLVWTVWRQPHGFGRSQNAALRHSVQSFQAAWLTGDMETARAYLVPEDRPRLHEWSQPRRAALVAGFGRNFASQVIEVEVLQEQAQAATVRVAFRIQGRKQQTFQLWRYIDGQWLMILDD